MTANDCPVGNAKKKEKEKENPNSHRLYSMFITVYSRQTASHEHS